MKERIKEILELFVAIGIFLLFMVVYLLAYAGAISFVLFVVYKLLDFGSRGSNHLFSWPAVAVEKSTQGGF